VPSCSAATQTTLRSPSFRSGLRCTATPRRWSYHSCLELGTLYRIVQLYRRTSHCLFSPEPHLLNGSVQCMQDSTFISGAFQDPVPFVLPANSGGHCYSSRDRTTTSARAPIAVYGGETLWFRVPRPCIATQLAGYTLDNSGSNGR
jgi:hypothetical protein